jgi:hypothetical protein
MPDSSGPVRLARLPELPDAAFRAFVRFPAGWSRTLAGHYAAAEEIFLLEGELHLNEFALRAGGYLWVPALGARIDSRAEGGCLALAWFSGFPRWTRAEGARAPTKDWHWHRHWRDAPVAATAIDATSHLLRTGPEHACWVTGRATAASTARAAPMPLETLSLADYTWRFHATGAVDPRRSATFWRSLGPLEAPVGAAEGSPS